MTKRTKVFILAGGKAEGLLTLARLRAKAAVPFGGKYRVIDFTLSNCVHSNIHSIAVLAQYNPESLLDHIRMGKPWDMDRMRGGIRIYQPYAVKDGRFWYSGTADALKQNVELMTSDDIDKILVLSGDNVYKMDYNFLLFSQNSNDYPITLAITSKPESELHKYGVVQVGSGEKVVSFVEKPIERVEGFASMGVYLFKRDYLLDILRDEGGSDVVDMVYDIIIPAVGRGEVGYYLHNSYWQDIGDISTYFRTNMELLMDYPLLNLHDTGWQILTRTRDEPPIRLMDGSRAVNSFICDGCVIRGSVENSILSPTVIVEEGSHVSNSIIFEKTVIGRGTIVRDAIVDKLVKIGSGVVVGSDENVPNENYPFLNEGITVIGKGTTVPDGFEVGSNCCLDIFLTKSDYPGDKIPSGKSLILQDKEARARGEHLLI